MTWLQGWKFTGLTAKVQISQYDIEIKLLMTNIYLPLQLHFPPIPDMSPYPPALQFHKGHSSCLKCLPAIVSLPVIPGDWPSSFKEELSNSQPQEKDSFCAPFALPPKSFPSSTLRIAWYWPGCNCLLVYLHYNVNLRINTASFSLCFQYLYLAYNRYMTKVYFIYFISNKILCISKI